MYRNSLIWLLLTSLSLGLIPGLVGQTSEVQIKVYNFDDGLSHRNVFRIVQDESGYLWLATINGLNRFDGYSFSTHSANINKMLPTEMVSDVQLNDDGRLWLASPDYISLFDPISSNAQPFQIKDGDIVRRQSWVPYNLLLAANGTLWLSTFQENSGQNNLHIYRDGKLRLLSNLPGAYTQRALANWQDRVYVGIGDLELRWYNPVGVELGRLDFPKQAGLDARIVAIQGTSDKLYVLLNDGRLYQRGQNETEFSLHPVSEMLNLENPLGSLLVEEDGDCWLGGLGTLWYYDARERSLTNYDTTVRQLTKNNCNYRQIMRDRSGAIWIASDFGAIKITQSEQLFSNYLSGGSEYCSNIYCSTRGITEDEAGNIYVSYYNSIHVIDPRSNGVRPLFPTNSYFNFPFGILYHDGSLYTGNGRRIYLDDLHVDTLINDDKIQDLGTLALDQENHIWIGYKNSLYRFDPLTEELIDTDEESNLWDSLAGNISYLHMGREYLWVGTSDNGIHQIDIQSGRVGHFHSREDSPVRLSNDRINAIYEDENGEIWLATGNGLDRISADYQQVQIYGEEQGLPNAFINGLLPEGDSCFWLSTDNGLCRFSLLDLACTNFFTSDGLSSNEFNRISFYKSRDGRMYFGGLNGVNAFYPDDRFLERKAERSEADLLLSQFTYLDGAVDSLLSLRGSTLYDGVSLSHNDRMFTVDFSLADYRQPGRNEYSYYLEGFESEWSPATNNHSVRYTDIPPGDYIFRAKGRAGREEWNPQEINLHIHIQRAYYQYPGFWIAAGLIAFGLFYALIRYRLYLGELRRKELEKEVKQRTAELEEEKKKSEDLLLNILPAETAEELKQFGKARAKRHDSVTVFFSDFKGFRSISEQLEPEELVEEIDVCFRAFDKITDHYGLEKIKTIGDAYLLVGGISGDERDQARLVVQAALDIQAFMLEHKLEREAENASYFEARIGIHTGPIVAGIVGIKKFAYDIWGDTVNIAARMESNGQVGRVNVSETTRALIQDDFSWEEHGVFQEHQTEMHMFWAKALTTVDV